MLIRVRNFMLDWNKSKNIIKHAHSVQYWYYLMHSLQINQFWKLPVAGLPNIYALYELVWIPNYKPVFQANIILSFITYITFQWTHLDYAVPIIWCLYTNILLITSPIYCSYTSPSTTTFLKLAIAVLCEFSFFCHILLNDVYAIYWSHLMQIFSTIPSTIIYYLSL